LTSVIYVIENTYLTWWGLCLHRWFQTLCKSSP